MKMHFGEVPSHLKEGDKIYDLIRIVSLNAASIVVMLGDIMTDD